MKNCIAIDGPSGTGKSTTAKDLSNTLGIAYVDTGAMYRAIGYVLNKQGVNLNDENAVVENMSKIDLELQYVDGNQRIYANGEDVTDTIRTQEIGEFASTIAVYKDVRKKLVQMQQEIANKNDVIMDGRDIGSCVLPLASFKFYLDANPEVRAKRRIHELKEKGTTASYDQVLQEIIERDERDKNREESPLVKASDAIYIDTSNLTKGQVVSLMLKIIEDK